MFSIPAEPLSFLGDLMLNSGGFLVRCGQERVYEIDGGSPSFGWVAFRGLDIGVVVAKLDGAGRGQATPLPRAVGASLDDARHLPLRCSLRSPNVGR